MNKIYLSQEIVKMKLNRVIISGGGTGGHIFPALAIADQIKERNSAAEVLFVGALGKMEMEKVPQAGYPIIGLPIVGLQRKLSLKNLLLPFKLLSSLLKAYRVIKNFNPELVIGVGGYASGPTLKMAQFLGIPTLIQEQNSYAGKTNQLLAKKAKAICVAYPDMEKFFPKAKMHFTGNPLRSNLLQNDAQLRAEAASYFGLDLQQPTLFVMGGSLGAKTLNSTLRNGVFDLASQQVQLIWQCGKSYQSTLQTFANTLPNSVKVFPFIQRMDLAYAIADVVVSRAGALSVSELALLAKPTIFVPSPNVAEDHQTQNALSLVNRDAAYLVRDVDAQTALLPLAIKLLNDKQQQKELSEKLGALALPNASKSIVDVCQQILTT